MKAQIKKILRPFYRAFMVPLRMCRSVLLAVAVAFVRMLPVRFWLELREKGQLVSTMDYDRHGQIRMRVDSWIEYDYRLKEAQKEPETVSWIETWFKPGDVFYDIGANVGSYSLIAHRFCEADIKVYAFEPGCMTYPHLCQNILLNDAMQQISPFQVALYDETMLTWFHYQNLLSGGALHALHEPKDGFGDRFTPVSSLPAICYRLDDFAHQFELLPPAHVKIDVDGTEFQILRGAVETLKSPGVKSLMLETYDGNRHLNDIGRLVSECGFVLHSRENDNYLYLK
jgi:FkbM family methyltransferase